jgi:bacterioferritin (cytochrome b1)
MKQQYDAQLIEELHRLMAEELEAFLRYFQLRYRLDGARKTEEEYFKKALAETLEHAEAIAAHIRSLGHAPRIQINLSMIDGQLGFKEALSESLIFEQEALDAYKEMLPRVKGNASLEKFIRHQIATEGEHVQEITKLLK